MIEQELRKENEWEAKRNERVEGDVYADDEDDWEEEQNTNVVGEFDTNKKSKLRYNES